MKRPNVLHVSAELAGQTLEAVLRKWRISREGREIRRLVRERRVLLDGNLAKDPTVKLKNGQVIKLLPEARATEATEADVRLRYYDADVIVVEKPAGMTSIRHPDEARLSPRRQQRQPTLTELLPRLLARVEAAREGRSKRRPVRAVHRLDRDTSGLMVFARNTKAETHLGHQFRAHSIQRVYWAIVVGHVKQQTIDANLITERSGRRAATSRTDLGKRAVTHVKPVEHLPGFTLVECRLETGRTHQIRIHLAHGGHPVCGDKVYGSKARRPPDAKKNVATRLALHARLLGFRHPKDDRLLEFESPLPEELQRMLLRLRGNRADTREGRPESE